MLATMIVSVRSPNPSFSLASRRSLSMSDPRSRMFKRSRSANGLGPSASVGWLPPVTSPCPANVAPRLLASTREYCAPTAVGMATPKDSTPTSPALSIRLLRLNTFGRVWIWVSAMSATQTKPNTINKTVSTWSAPRPAAMPTAAVNAAESQDSPSSTWTREARTPNIDRSTTKNAPAAAMPVIFRPRCFVPTSPRPMTAVERSVYRTLRRKRASSDSSPCSEEGASSAISRLGRMVVGVSSCNSSDACNGSPS